MNRLCFSAPGSIILAGEHTIFFGKPVLACAIDLRTTMSCSEKIQNNSLDTISQLIFDEIIRYLKKNNLYKNQKEHFFQITSEIPKSETFGYLDAKTVALTACIIKYYSKKPFTNEEINNLAYQTEKKINNKKLGIHCTASSFGGLIYYRKEFEFLKNISSLNVKIPKIIEEHLFFIDTGKVNKSYEELENYIGRLYNTDTKKTEFIFNEIEKVTKRLVIAIVKEDTGFFKKSIKQLEQLLENLGIVCEFTKYVIRDIEEFGVAKIIGNGFLFVYSEDVDKLKKLVEKYNLSYFKFQQSVKGLVQRII